MIRALIWFRCAAAHDPVRPVQTGIARIGWVAKRRQVDLEIERAFSGDELLRRMKGWITVDPELVIDRVAERGRLRVLDDRDLVVECRTAEDFEALRRGLHEACIDQVDLEVLKGEM